MGEAINHCHPLIKCFKAHQAVLRIMGRDIRVGYLSSHWLLEEVSMTSKLPSWDKQMLAQCLVG